MSQQRGDTIVEVMVAFAVFTLIAVGSVTVMNRGLALAQRSLEVTLVREQIDGQAELLRYVRDTSSTEWGAIKAHLAADGGDDCPIRGNLPAAAFYMNVETNGAVKSVGDIASRQFPVVDTYSWVTLGNSPRTQGLWIVPVRVGASNAYDMHIHACWDSVGSDQPVTLGTIVRLYDT